MEQPQTMKYQPSQTADRTGMPTDRVTHHPHLVGELYAQELNTYFKSMHHTPLLTQEEELSIGRTIKENLEALLKLVLTKETSFLPLRALQKKTRLWQNNPKSCGLSIETILCLLDRLLPKLENNRKLEKELAGFSADVRERRRLLQVALDRMITANLRLVVKIAKNYRHRGVSFQDVLQEGNLGLMKACLRYDHTTGYRLSTYAHWWIRQSIIRALHGQSHTIRLPVHFYGRINAFHNSFFQLRQDLGRDPSVEEVSEHSGLSNTKILAVIRANFEPISLETPIGQDGEQLADHIVNTEAASPEQTTQDNQLRRLLKDGMASLVPRERRIIVLRFGLDEEEPQTLDQVGRLMNISRERVRQLEKRALLRMKNFLGNIHN
jgi:RNA polymerase primary sigma factor